MKTALPPSLAPKIQDCLPQDEQRSFSETLKTIQTKILSVLELFQSDSQQQASEYRENLSLSASETQERIDAFLDLSAKTSLQEIRDLPIGEIEGKRLFQALDDRILEQEFTKEQKRNLFREPGTVSVSFFSNSLIKQIHSGNIDEEIKVVYLHNDYWNTMTEEALLKAFVGSEHYFKLDFVLSSFLTIPEPIMISFLKDSPNIKTLKIIFDLVDTQAVEKLSKYLSFMPNLTNLDAEGHWLSLPQESYQKLAPYLGGLRSLQVPYNTIEKSYTLRAHQTFCSNLRQLDWYVSGLEDETPQDLVGFFGSLSHLRSLTLSGESLGRMTPQQITSIFGGFHQLKDLTLVSFNTQEMPMQNVQAIFACLPHLSHLTFSRVEFGDNDVHSDSFLSALPQLKSLSFPECNMASLSIQTLQDFFSHQSQLSHLDLSGHEEIPFLFDEFNLLGPASSQIKSLNLSHSSLPERIRTRGMIFFDSLSELTNLESLDLSSCHLNLLDTQELKALASAIRHVKFLNIIGWSNEFNPEQIEAFFQGAECFETILTRPQHRESIIARFPSLTDTICRGDSF